MTPLGWTATFFVLTVICAILGFKKSVVALIPDEIIIIAQLLFFGFLSGFVVLFLYVWAVSSPV